MNNKQKLVFLLMLLVFVGLAYLGPRYKIAYLDAGGQNYLKTYRFSPGYENFSGAEHVVWDKTLMIVAPTLVFGGLLLLISRERKPKKDERKPQVNTIRRA